MKRAVLVALLAVWPYVGALDAPFVFDDVAALETNVGVQRGECGAIGNSRWLSHCAAAKTAAWMGFRPESFHGVSMVVHGANAVLVFLIALSFMGRNAACFAGGVFALHPVQVESVIYAAQQAELWWSFFGLLAVLVLLRVRGGWGWGLAMALAGLSFKAKESAVVLPVLFVMIRRVSWKMMLTLGSGLALMACYAGWQTWSSIGPNRPGHLGSMEYFVISAGTWWNYLCLSLIPINQNVDPAVSARMGSAVAGLAFALGLLFISIRRRSLPAMGMMWWFLTILPTSSVVVLLDPMAEHRLYFALAGSSIAAAALLQNKNGSQVREPFLRS